MTLTPLSAISPIDGRYRNTTSQLAAYFSEYALIKYRVFVEVEYFIALFKHPLPQLQGLDIIVAEKLRDIYLNFNEADAQSIKDIEKITNHDVKAVEYFIKQKFYVSISLEFLTTYCRAVSCGCICGNFKIF